MKKEIEEIINMKLKTDKDVYYLKLDDWVTILENKKLEVYKYCREKGIEIYINKEKKYKCFKIKKEYPLGYNPYQE